MFHPPKPVGMELNLAPMVDVMMCLIIFFLLASTLVNAENTPVKLPWAIAAREIDRKELGNRVVVNVHVNPNDPKEADYVVARLEPQAGGGLEIVEKSLTPKDIEEFLVTTAARAAARKDELRCIIRADQEVRYSHIEVILRACGLAKIGKITFSANAGVEGAT